ncbi:MAG: M13 family metallopeptidase [Bacteroidota bacterium]
MKFTLRQSIMASVGIIALSLGTASCGDKGKDKKAEPAINAANMDTTVKAGDDFYKFANGTWLKNNPIPAQYSRYGAFEVLEEENYVQLKSILAEASADKNAAEGSVNQKIRDFYNSGMDSVKIDKDGINPLKAELEQINSFATIADVQKMIAMQHASGNYPLFYLFSSPDDKNSNQVIASTYQGGLGLPDRDYYLGMDARSKEIRESYVKHMVKMFVLAGSAPEQAAKDADVVMKIETEIAKFSSTRLDLRDPNANYNKTDLAGLQKMAPGLDWKAYFDGIKLQATNEINVGQPKFMTGITKLLNTVSVADWKVYFRWDLINSAASSLSSDFDKEHFAFYGTVLSGVKEQQPRWKRMLDQTSSSLGEAVGQLYVQKFFPPEAKKRMVELVGNLKISLGERINGLTWMSDTTKKEAQAKLAKINVKIGYPDKWIDYSSLTIGTDSYYANKKNARQFAVNRDIVKIGKPVDRSEWGMTPQTINAYYSPNMNEIVFPAAILQPPFFFMDADDAVNYGAIGMVISHEMTHGFDDQGRQYDKDGNLHDWWLADDSKNFEGKTKVLVDQYDNYKILDSLHVDGKLTLGENIADLGGMNVAYNGLQKAFEGKKKDEKIDGFTPDQRFFLSYAQVWRANIREKETMRRLKEDVHSPGDARVNAIVYNIPAFYTAFNIEPTDKRYIAPENRADIW